MHAATGLLGLALGLVATITTGQAAAAPVEPASGVIVQVTVPSLLTLTVVSTQPGGGCRQEVVVTDTRADRVGFTVDAGTAQLTAVQVPGNGLSAADVQVSGGRASYPAGLGGGSVRLVAVGATCPAWTVL